MAREISPARRLIGRAAAKVYRHRVYRMSWSPADQPAVDIPLPEGFALVRGTENDLPLLEQMGAGFDRAADFLAAGHRLWLLTDGERLAFSAWTFMETAPSDGPRTGWMVLPEGTVNQEDSNAHPDFRGKGLAVVASQLIAAELLREGAATRVVTAILDTNTASRRAAAKSVWREFAVIDIKKFGLLRRDDQWRLRRGDGPLVLTRLAFARPEVDGGLTPADEELFTWIQLAMKRGVRGPRRAVPVAVEPAAAVGAGQA
jgi:hypothetical protein